MELFQKLLFDIKTQDSITQELGQKFGTTLMNTIDL